MRLLLQLAILTVFGSACLLSAAPDSKTGVTHLPLKGTVVAITPYLLTLKGGKGKEDRKFTITKSTKILKGEINALTDDVRLEQIVTGSYVRNAKGVDTLTMLQIAPKPPTPKKKPAPKPEADNGKGKNDAGGAAKKGAASTKKTL